MEEMNKKNDCIMSSCGHSSNSHSSGNSNNLNDAVGISSCSGTNHSVDHARDSNQNSLLVQEDILKKKTYGSTDCTNSITDTNHTNSNTIPNLIANARFNSSTSNSNPNCNPNLDSNISLSSNVMDPNILLDPETLFVTLRNHLNGLMSCIPSLKEMSSQYPILYAALDTLIKYLSPILLELSGLNLTDTNLFYPSLVNPLDDHMNTENPLTAFIQSTATMKSSSISSPSVSPSVSPSLSPSLSPSSSCSSLSSYQSAQSTTNVKTNKKEKNGTTKKTHANELQQQTIQEQGKKLTLSSQSTEHIKMKNNDKNELIEASQNKAQQGLGRKTDETLNIARWSGFYKKSLQEKLSIVNEYLPTKNLNLSDNKSFPDLPYETANLMIENCIGVHSLPLGLGLNFIINGREYAVPMLTEEPSVIAAASSAAKCICSSSTGFQTISTNSLMVCQIQILDVLNMEEACKNIEKEKFNLINYANQILCPKMKQRGGGVVDIYCRCLETMMKTQENNKWYKFCKDEVIIEPREYIKNNPQLIVHIETDVCEAMGANIVNTIGEGLISKLAHVANGRQGIAILSNLCPNRRTKSSFQINVKHLGWKGINGKEVAERIVETNRFGIIDPFRAITNNKGIMNGVSAVCLSTGQDTRAVEASCHCYASRTGRYTSLSKYQLICNEIGEEFLQGELELPITVGVIGGAISTHPGYKKALEILKNPTSKELAGIIVSVGLAQNFAALRALSITGIQLGHMSLHARNIALSAGATNDNINELCEHMIKIKNISVDAAKSYLQNNIKR